MGPKSTGDFGGQESAPPRCARALSARIEVQWRGRDARATRRDMAGHDWFQRVFHPELEDQACGCVQKGKGGAAIRGGGDRWKGIILVKPPPDKHGSSQGPFGGLGFICRGPLVASMLVWGSVMLLELVSGGAFIFSIAPIGSEIVRHGVAKTVVIELGCFVDLFPSGSTTQRERLVQHCQLTAKRRHTGVIKLGASLFLLQ